MIAKTGTRASREGQIKSNLFKLDGEVEWLPNLPNQTQILNVRAFRIELEFRSVSLLGEGKTGVPGEKPLGTEKIREPRTNSAHL